MATWFTADTHFGHDAIRRMCSRPFGSLDEHDEALTDAWNAVVRPNDDVWHLGDFAFRGRPERAERTFRRLHGRKRLVIGNHDKAATLALPWAEPPALMRFVTVEGERLVLCHYGLRVWPGQWTGAIHLYGHSHGRLPGTHASEDVGVDAWPGYVPVSLDRIKVRLALRPAAPPEDSPRDDEAGPSYTP